MSEYLANYDTTSVPLQITGPTIPSNIALQSTITLPISITTTSTTWTVNTNWPKNVQPLTITQPLTGQVGTSASTTYLNIIDVAEMFGMGLKTFEKDLNEHLSKKCLVMMNHLTDTRSVVPKIFAMRYAYNQWILNWPLVSGMSSTYVSSPAKRLENPFVSFIDSEYDVYYVDAVTEEELNNSFDKLQFSDIQTLSK